MTNALYDDRLLRRFEARNSTDVVKRSLELTCTECDEPLCDIEAGDSFDSLAIVMAEHVCDDESEPDAPGHTPDAPQEAGDGSGPTDDTPPTPESPTEAHRLRELVHEGQNVVWASDNGGHRGRPSEVKRLLRAICDEAERIWGSL